MSRQLKILQIIPYFPPYIGGQERYIYNLCKYLKKKGHEITIATSDYPHGAVNSDENWGRIKRYNCIIRPLRNPITPGMLDLKKEIDDYDLIHTHNEHSFAAIMASHLRAMTDKPLILTCHGQLRFGDAITDTIERLYSRCIGRKILGRCDAICVNSILDMKYIGSLNPKRGNEYQAGE